MTDLERDRIVGGIIDAYTLAPNDEDEKREAVARQVDVALAAARREGAEEARKQTEAVMEAFAHRMKQTGAEEMRERAADQAHLVWGDGQIAASIRALPLTPEEPT